MRHALIVVLLTGCGAAPIAADAAVESDAAVDAAPACTNPALCGSFHVPVGAACDEAETIFCADGTGLCYEAICRAQCSPVQVPRCPDGFAEFHRPTPEHGDSCLCMPS